MDIFNHYSLLWITTSSRTLELVHFITWFSINIVLFSRGLVSKWRLSGLAKTPFSLNHLNVKLTLKRSGH